MTRQVIDTETDHGTYRGDPAKTAFGKVNANDKAIYPIVDARTYVHGFRMTRSAANALTVSEGAAYVPSLDRIIAIEAPVVLSGIVVAAASWLHLYLFENASGVASLELSATVPSGPYAGPARTKSGDITRRYLGSVRSIGANTLARFNHNPATGTVRYTEDINQSFLRVLVNGVATSSTNVSCSNCVPVSARSVFALAENMAADASAIVFIANSDMGAASSANIALFLRAPGLAYGDIPLDASLQFNYARNAASTGGLAVWCCGYTFER